MSIKLPSHDFSIYNNKSGIIITILLLALLGIGGTSIEGNKKNPKLSPSSSPLRSGTPSAGSCGFGNCTLQLKVFYPPSTTPTQVQASVPTSMPLPTQQIPPGKIWSMGYYLAWQQNGYTPQMVPWKDFTDVIYFSLTTRSDGTLNYNAMTPQSMTAFVSEAHKHNVKALLSTGGDGDLNWHNACGSSGTVSIFVNNLVNIMHTYGFDGLDLDIEDDPQPPNGGYYGYPNYIGYTACIQQLRSTLDKISPRPILTMAVDPSWQAWMASHAWQYVDYINMMSYGANVSSMDKLINNFTSRGFPKSRLGIGIDFVADANAAWCGGLAQYAVNNGVGGIMEWAFSEDQRQHNGQTPCLDAIAPYVPVH